MTIKKLSMLLVVGVTLMFSLAPLAQASPGLQQGDDTLEQPGGTDNSLGDTVTPTVKYNLGTVMAGKTAPLGEGTTTPVDDTDPGETIARHPVAAALANFFGVTYDEVFGLHEAGNGFGNIAKAYFFAEVIGTTPADLLEQVHGAGWGNVLKENGIHPGAVGQGVKPGKKNKPTDDAVDVEINGASGQSDKDKNNNGHGQNKDKPNKPDKDKNKGKGKK
ncbi:MAG: hypothetical protein FOGNACKC_00584 [Anaerolineae bacterium]|nr:hypothetical protein [Anaerolineae bacterium]